MANNIENTNLNVLIKQEHKQLVPKLRFPEFRGEWQWVKVSDLLEFYPTNSLSWDNLDFAKGEIYNLHYGLIHKGLPTMVDLSLNDLPFIKDQKTPNNYTLCKEGDIAFADASEDTNDVAKATEFINCNGKDIVCGLHTIHGRDKANSTIIGYKGYAFASESFHNQVRRLAQGTKIYSINTRNFAEAYIGVPSKKEQEKIAHLLIAIDKRITTQNKIIDKLQSIITGLRTQLLRSIRTNYVELRSIANIYQPLTISSDELTKKGYLVYGANGIIGHYHSYNHATEQICITCRGNTCGTVNFTKPESWITGNAMVINVDDYLDKVNKRYLFHYLSSQNFSKIISGSGQPQIVRTPLEKLKINLPNIDEQVKQVKILDSLFDKIDNEKTLLSSIQKCKYYLLRQMFI